jgi:hypothetical protein
MPTPAPWRRKRRRFGRWSGRCRNWRSKETQVNIQAPVPDWEIGYPSSVAMDAKGAIYVLQHGEKADPILVVNREGQIILFVANS